MKDLKQAQIILADTIKNNAKHIDYLRVTQLAKEYQDIFTGKGVADFLSQVRTSDPNFEQTLRIYQSTIPATVNNLTTIFEKPLRSNRVFKSVDHESTKARDEIYQRMDAFWQGGEGHTGIDAYLAERWKHLSIYDPNAFIAVEFSSFNPITEKTWPFALEFSSSEAINYSYVKGVLDWLIIEQKIKYTSGPDPKIDKTVEGSRFLMYLDDDQIELLEVDIKTKYTDIPQPVFFEILDDQGLVQRVFVIRIFNTKSNGVPAFRVGFIQDAQSLSTPRTCLSLLHYALAFFKKEMISGVELDLTIRAHAFPKTFMYGPKCEGDPENGIVCKNGKQINGEVCPVCLGSQTPQQVHTSASDLVVVPFPKNGADAVVNLNEAMATFSPPVELLNFMVDYEDRLTAKAKGAIFASEAIARNTNSINLSGQDSNATATGQDYSYDNVYDTFRPYTGKYSYCWLFLVRMIAVYTDNETGLKLFHYFPKDYKLRGDADLISVRQAATTAEVPQYLLDAIDIDLEEVLYADDPDTLSKIRVQRKFMPFRGKGSGEIVSLLNSALVQENVKLLYINFGDIFQDIDETIGDVFYISYTYLKQKEEIDKRIQVYADAIAAQKLKTFQDLQNSLQTNPNKPQPAQ